jgi:DNA-binding CsgD family transcriptional regulator
VAGLLACSQLTASGDRELASIGYGGRRAADREPSFRRSLVPMVIADDDRRFVAANAAACLLLRLPEEDVLRLTVDDLTPLENRREVGRLWDAFIRDGTQEGKYELLMPDGARVAVEYSATANMEPGRHLSILMFPPGRIERDAPRGSKSVLTSREREVLAMVAMGRSSSSIAAALGVATSTVESHVPHCLDKPALATVPTPSRSDCAAARSPSSLIGSE